MTTDTEISLRPCGSHLLLKVDKPALMSKGGVHLPEVAWKLPVSGTVIAVGPGRSVTEKYRTTIWTSEGDCVLFEHKNLREIEGTQEYALLLAEDVLAFVDLDGTVHPENDWVLVWIDEREWMTPGGLYLPEAGRKKSKTGTILDIGPGRLVLKGKRYGTRVGVAQLMGLIGEEGLVGSRCWWQGMEPVVRLSQPRGQALIRASDVMAFEEQG